MPLRSLDAAVVVGVEIVEPILAVVIDVVAEEFRLRERVVAVAVGAEERFAIVIPLGACDPPVAVVIEVGEAALGPIPELRPPVRIVVVLGRLTRRADANFPARQDAVAVPVVHAERLSAAAPFVAANRAVAIRVHRTEAHLARLRLTGLS